MFDSFSPLEWIAVVVAGLAIGYFLLPYLLKSPIVGGWVAGMIFFGIRFIIESNDNPQGRPDRILGASLLWTAMAIAAEFGRRLVRHTFPQN